MLVHNFGIFPFFCLRLFSTVFSSSSHQFSTARFSHPSLFLLLSTLTSSSPTLGQFLLVMYISNSFNNFLTLAFFFLSFLASFSLSLGSSVDSSFRMCNKWSFCLFSCHTTVFTRFFAPGVALFGPFPLAYFYQVHYVLLYFSWLYFPA